MKGPRTRKSKPCGGEGLKKPRPSSPAGVNEDSQSRTIVGAHRAGSVHERCLDEAAPLWYELEGDATSSPDNFIVGVEPLGMTIHIQVRPSEAVDSVIMRLRREVNKSGHLRKLRTKRYFEDAREKKKRKVAESRRAMKFQRQRKRRTLAQAP